MVTPDELRELIAAYPEWLLVRDSGRSFPLSGSEIEVTTADDRTLLGFLDDGGFHSCDRAGLQCNRPARGEKARKPSRCLEAAVRQQPVISDANAPAAGDPLYDQ